MIKQERQPSIWKEPKDAVVEVRSVHCRHCGHYIGEQLVTVLNKNKLKTRREPFIICPNCAKNGGLDR